MVPDSSRQHHNPRGIAKSYSLSTGIYCPRPTDGDDRMILRLGSRLGIFSTSNNLSSRYIRSYRKIALLFQYPSQKCLDLSRFSVAVRYPNKGSFIKSQQSVCGVSIANESNELGSFD